MTLVHISCNYDVVFNVSGCLSISTVHCVLLSCMFIGQFFLILLMLLYHLLFCLKQVLPGRPTIYLLQVCCREHHKVLHSWYMCYNKYSHVCLTYYFHLIGHWKPWRSTFFFLRIFLSWSFNNFHACSNIHLSQLLLWSLLGFHYLHYWRCSVTHNNNC